MKPLAAIVLLFGILAAHQAQAEDVSLQPLARAECSGVSMTWDESANVCVADSGDLSGHPLTRLDCVAAGRQWNDQANVCGEPAEPVIQANTTPGSVVLINVDKATQRMIVFVDGAEQYNWPVSTGLRGYSTPSGTYTASWIHEMWYSREWDEAPMPHAVFFTKDGHAIHGTKEVKRLGKPASHGCVRLSPKNAALLYSLVAKTGLEHTQIELIGTTPGGESREAGLARSKSRGEGKVSARSNSRGKVASQARSKFRGKVASQARSKFRGKVASPAKYDAESYDQPRWQGRRLRRLFGRR